MRNKIVLFQQLKKLDTTLERPDFKAIQEDIATFIEEVIKEKENLPINKLNELVGRLRKNLFSLLSDYCVYPSPMYNLLHNGLLLLAHHYPHSASISDDNGRLQCAIEWSELKPRDRYFVTAEGLHYSQKSIKNWFFKKNDYKNPFTQLEFTPRDKDRVQLYCLQNLNYFQRLQSHFNVTFSVDNARCYVRYLVLFSVSITIIHVLLLMISNLFLSEENVTKTTAFSNLKWIVDLCKISTTKIGLAALLGGLRISYSDNSISTLKHRIGECYENPELKTVVSKNSFFNHKDLESRAAPSLELSSKSL